MAWIYSILITLADAIMPLIGLFVSGKTKDFIKGRSRQSFEKLTSKSGKRYWFHCASLGEFEQARPVIERLKSVDPACSIVVSFFSPSGYQQRHSYALADLVCYLPLDTPLKARKFINDINPDVAIFVKYEIWYNYIRTLYKKGIPTYLISATFRSKQFIMKRHGAWLFKVLKYYKSIFVQDTLSYGLLESKGLINVEISGDTRYDRVKQTAMAASTNEILSIFKAEAPMIIFGSSWQAEEKLASEMVRDSRFNVYKFLIAPHDISETHIRQISSLFDNTCRYTAYKEDKDCRVLLLDTIGHLASAYHYADIAVIGGGFGEGLHNILESLAFGVPVVFGPQVDRYPEARQSLAAEVALKIENTSDVKMALEKFLPGQTLENAMRAKCFDFINWRSGATEKVVKELMA